uniref:Uncharacterized protein n=1 Tax=Anthurium amnicola TaxID=1678845 RepID=A0A1D1XP73_9ARAE
MCLRDLWCLGSTAAEGDSPWESPTTRGIPKGSMREDTNVYPPARAPLTADDATGGTSRNGGASYERREGRAQLPPNDQDHARNVYKDTEPEESTYQRQPKSDHARSTYKAEDEEEEPARKGKPKKPYAAEPTGKPRAARGEKKTMIADKADVYTEKDYKFSDSE